MDGFGFMSSQWIVSLFGSGLPWEEDVVNWRENTTGKVSKTREKGESHHDYDHGHDLLPTLRER